MAKSMHFSLDLESPRCQSQRPTGGIVGSQLGKALRASALEEMKRRPGTARLSLFYIDNVPSSLSWLGQPSAAARPFLFCDLSSKYVRKRARPPHRGRRAGLRGGDGEEGSYAPRLGRARRRAASMTLGWMVAITPACSVGESFTSRRVRHRCGTSGACW